MAFRETLAAFVLGRIGSDDLPNAALQAVEEGLESQELAALAGSASPRSEALDQWHRGLRELGVVLPSRVEAAFTLRDHLVAQVASSALAPREGAADLRRLAHETRDVLPYRKYVGDGLGVERLVGLYYSHDDVRDDDEAAHRRIDDDIRAECRRIADERPRR